jgi:hypothetical protein
MTIKEARACLGLGETASRQEIIQAYRRAARRWHPDRAPGGGEAECRAQMQRVNAAYQRLKEFMEAYRFRLEDIETGEDAAEWWQERFYTGVWGPPPKGRQASADEAAKPGRRKNKPGGPTENSE